MSAVEEAVAAPDLAALVLRLEAVEAELKLTRAALDENSRIVRGGFERFGAILERGEKMFESLQTSKAFRMMTK